MKLMFSHEWTLHSTLDLVQHSCTTQGQIQEENDYAIVKVSTTTTIIATHYEVINPSGHSSTAISKKPHYISVFLLVRSNQA